MSKNKTGKQQDRPEVSTKATPAPLPVIVPDQIPIDPVIRTPAGRIIEEHRHCPLCWSGSQGYGTAYSTSPNGRTYYRCNQSLGHNPPCGHTWSVVIETHAVVVTHKTVQFDGLR